MSTENVGITPGSGANIAADQITDKDATGAVISHQRVKLETGPDGVVNDVSVYNPAPVADTVVISLLKQILIELRVANSLAIQNVDFLGSVEDYRRDENDALNTNLDQE
jgi:hypothetical protein